MPKTVRSAPDRRVARTRRALRDALAALLHEKPYDAIGVQDILDRADVGRSTFYTHFRDKDELLEAGIDAMLFAVPQPARGSSERWEERLLWFSRPIFEFHAAQRAAGAAPFHGRARAVLHARLQRALAATLAPAVRAEFAPRHASPIPPDLLTASITATFSVVFEWWLDQPQPPSVERAEAVFRALVIPTLATLAR